MSMTLFVVPPRLLHPETMMVRPFEQPFPDLDCNQANARWRALFTATTITRFNGNTVLACILHNPAGITHELIQHLHRCGQW